MRTTLAIFASAALAATAPAYAASTAADVLGANQAAEGNWAGKAVLKTEFAYAGQGMSGKTQSLSDLTRERWVDTFAIGSISGGNGFDGTHAWEKEPSGTVGYQDGVATRPIMINDAYRRANLWWRADRAGASVQFDPEKTEGGATYDVLTVTPKDGAPFDAWFVTKTHLLSRIAEKQGAVMSVTTLSDYHAVDGALLPSKTVISTGDTKYDQTLVLTSAKFLPAQDDSAFAMPANKVADFFIAGGAKETVIPFHLVNNHIYANVSVNGHGPYLFIFDTGGLNLVTPALAQKLGLPMEGDLEARGAGEGTMKASITKVDSLELGAASVKGTPFFSIPLDAMANVEGVEMPGMIGFETFRRFVTRVDYGAQTITLTDPKAFDPKGAGTAVPISFDGNVPEAEATYDGITGKFMIDTGARTGLILTVPFVANNKLRTPAAKGLEGVTGWGVGGPTRSFAMRGGALKIGTVAVNGTVTLLSTDKGGAMADAALAGNIGGGVLKRFVVTFDYEHNTMYLKPVGKPVADLDTFDRAGVWINKDAEGLKVVDVTAHAPAEEAGLKAGDIIVAVDGKPATGLALNDLRVRLRNDAPGTVVTFTVKQGSATKDVNITLRDLI